MSHSKHQKQSKVDRTTAKHDPLVVTPTQPLPLQFIKNWVVHDPSFSVCKRTPWRCVAHDNHLHATNLSMCTCFFDGICPLGLNLGSLLEERRRWSLLSLSWSWRSRRTATLLLVGIFLGHKWKQMASEGVLFTPIPKSLCPKRRQQWPSRTHLKRVRIHVFTK